jgi:hypothetical protein
MTVKEAKKYLDHYDDDDEIIVTWWDKDMAPCDIKNIPWENQVDIIENKMDWSGTSEDMGTCIEIYSEED